MIEQEEGRWYGFTWVHTDHLPVRGWRALWPVRALYRLLNRFRD